MYTLLLAVQRSAASTSHSHHVRHGHQSNHHYRRRALHGTLQPLMHLACGQIRRSAVQKTHASVSSSPTHQKLGTNEFNSDRRRGPHPPRQPLTPRPPLRKPSSHRQRSRNSSRGGPREVSAASFPPRCLQPQSVSPGDAVPPQRAHASIRVDRCVCSRSRHSGDVLMRHGILQRW